MSEVIEQIAVCIEKGKINKNSPYPPDMKGQDGADEIAKNALDNGITPSVILEGCKLGMERIGEKFGQNKVFLPELLMAANAMKSVMEHLKPFFQSGEVKRKGSFIIGTVSGDLHDIGKNLVAMCVEGAGYEVVDLGVDIPSEKFIRAIESKPDSFVGMSALLTTTMVNMEKSVQDIKQKFPNIKILIGGAPVTQEFADTIDADGYSADPQGAVILLEQMTA